MDKTNPPLSFREYVAITAILMILFLGLVIIDLVGWNWTGIIVGLSSSAVMTFIIVVVYTVALERERQIKQQAVMQDAQWEDYEPDWDEPEATEQEPPEPWISLQ